MLQYRKQLNIEKICAIWEIQAIICKLKHYKFCIQETQNWYDAITFIFRLCAYSGLCNNSSSGDTCHLHPKVLFFFNYSEKEKYSNSPIRIWIARWGRCCALLTSSLSIFDKEPQLRHGRPMAKTWLGVLEPAKEKSKTPLLSQESPQILQISNVRNYLYVRLWF